MTKEEIPKALKTSAKCVFEGIEYTVTGFYLYADKKTKALKYSAVLLDKNANCTVQVPLELVILNKE